MNKFIVGLILGIVIAGGLAFYLNNMPNQFVDKVSNNQATKVMASSNPILLAPGIKLREASKTINSSSAISASSNNASAPNYDFYDILQGKKATNNSSAAVPKPLVVKYYVQAGAFSDPNLTNDMKARLALLGFDASIKSEQDKDKIINRIVIGPLDSEIQAQGVIQQLASNEIKATLIKTNN